MKRDIASHQQRQDETPRIIRTFKELSSVNLAGRDLEGDNMALREHLVSQAIHDVRFNQTETPGDNTPALR